MSFNFETRLLRSDLWAFMHLFQLVLWGVMVYVVSELQN